MHLPDHISDGPQAIKRPTFLGRAGYSVGSAALASLLGQHAHATARASLDAYRSLDYTPRARRVIHLCMAGGPSHLETFDQTPELDRLDGQPTPAATTRGPPLAQ